MEDNAINLHRKRNNILYFLFKAINKITFFLSIKTYFKDFQGFNNDIKTTNLKLNKFFNSNLNILNEMDKTSNKIDHVTDKDYINGFLELSKVLINKKDNTILYKKTINLDGKVISGK